MADSKTQEIRSNSLPALRLHGISVLNYHGLASSLTQAVSEARKRLDWAQIAEMQRHGMSIQSQGLRHVDLTALPTHSLDAGLAESKHCLEDRLGVQVEFLAAPHGILNRRVVGQAMAVGYRAVCSTRCWPARPGSKVLTRITVLSDISIEEFHGYLAGSFWPYAIRLSHGLLHRPFAIAGHLSGTFRHRVLNSRFPRASE